MYFYLLIIIFRTKIHLQQVKNNKAKHFLNVIQKFNNVHCLSILINFIRTIELFFQYVENNEYVTYVLAKIAKI